MCTPQLCLESPQIVYFCLYRKKIDHPVSFFASIRVLCRRRVGLKYCIVTTRAKAQAHFDSRVALANDLRQLGSKYCPDAYLPTIHEWRYTKQFITGYIFFWSKEIEYPVRVRESGRHKKKRLNRTQWSARRPRLDAIFYLLLTPRSTLLLFNRFPRLLFWGLEVGFERWWGSAVYTVPCKTWVC